MDDNYIIRGVWIGSALTAMQQLCIKSYIDNGHEFHLYITEPTSGIPDGAIVHSTDEIVPEFTLERFSGRNFYSDYFRARLIKEYGGWYVDVDTVCLKHFDFREPYVFVSEDTSKFSPQKDTKEPLTPCSEVVTNYVSGCIFKSQANSEFLNYIINQIDATDTKSPKRWESFGPDMFCDAVPRFSLVQYVKPPIVFDAANPNELYHLVDGNARYNISDKSYAMHFRTSWWGNSLSEKHHPDSMFEQLKRKHGVV